VIYPSSHREHFPVVYPERFLVFKTGRWEIAWTHCNMLGNQNPQGTGNCNLTTSTDYANFLSSYHWCWKLKIIVKQ